MSESKKVFVVLNTFCPAKLLDLSHFGGFWSFSALVHHTRAITQGKQSKQASSPTQSCHHFDRPGLGPDLRSRKNEKPEPRTWDSCNSPGEDASTEEERGQTKPPIGDFYYPVPSNSTNDQAVAIQGSSSEAGLGA